VFTGAEAHYSHVTQMGQLTVSEPESQLLLQV